MDTIEESNNLNRISMDGWYGKGANASMIRYCAEVFSRYWKGKSCLELGPAEGLMTELLEKQFLNLTLVDGSEEYCSALRKRFPRAETYHCLFEHFAPIRKFDTIVLGHVLEHVEDPVVLLENVRKWIEPNGVICSAVPNARSLHRQAAVIMGLLPSEDALNQTDIHHGHRRVYDPESFRCDFIKAGLKIKLFGGFWIKPLSNSQIEASWTADMLRSFMELGERYPDIAAENYVIASV
jgi:2-polyprenyl-3-methyl-5-hydroxy-6-metoxy-1,4-benzoquinol methylase